MRTGIVNLNLNIERVYEIPDFCRGKVFRSGLPAVQAGGKGVNVAKVLRTLGVKSELFGCAGGLAGEWIESRLRTDGLKIRTFRTKKESRTCIEVYDAKNGFQTVINEPGGRTTAAEASEIKKATAGFLRSKDIAVFSGSVPPGIGPVRYGEMVAGAVKRKIPVFVDAGGEYLYSAVKNDPFLIKPNIDEWQALTGRKAGSVKTLVSLTPERLRSNIEWIIISRGKKGFIALNRGDVFEVNVPSVEAVNAVGCGDALVAGFIKAFSLGQGKEELLRYAGAVSCAHTLDNIPGSVRISDISKVISKVSVVKHGR